MNDDKLTAAAAKAAGITAKDFSPLTDDADALRLAVKLRLCVGPNFHGDRAVCFRDDREDVRELFGNDPLAATRRAIVRAAAEIGRSMK